MVKQAGTVLGIAVFATSLALAIFLVRGVPRQQYAPSFVAQGSSDQHPTSSVAGAEAEPGDLVFEQVPFGRFAPGRDDRAIQVQVRRWGDGTPLPGVRVSVLDESTDVAGETDASGLLMLHGIRFGECIDLLATKEGFAPTCGCFEVDAEISITLAQAVELWGQVFAADTGLAVPHARVSLVEECAPGADPQDLESSDGRYSLSGVPIGRPVDVRLLADGFPEQWRTFEIREDASRVRLDFRLERGIEVSGRVVDLETDAAIAGAVVGAMVADRAGFFTGRILGSARDGGDEITVSAPGYCRLRASLAGAELAIPLEFRLPRVAFVEGVVRDASGSPLPYAWVQLRQPGAPMAASEGGFEHLPSPLDELPETWVFGTDAEKAKSRTGFDGRFRLQGVPWTVGEIVGGASGWEKRRQVVPHLAGPGRVTRIDLELEPSRPEATLSGEIWLNDNPLSAMEALLAWKGPSSEGKVTIRSNPYSVSVEPGEVSFQLDVRGLDVIEGDRFTLQLQDGERLDHRIELRTAQGVIRGRVTVGDGTGAAGACVRASRPVARDDVQSIDRLYISTHADERGYYELLVPDDGRAFSLEAEFANVLSEREGVPAGAEGVDFVLAPSGTLLFRILDVETGDVLAPAGFELDWRTTGKASYRRQYLGWPLTPDPEGWCTLQVSAGPIDLLLYEPRVLSGYQPARIGAAIVRPDQPLELEFALVRGLELELRMEPGADPFPPDHQVLLVESELWDEIERPFADRDPTSPSLGGVLASRLVRFGQEQTATVRALGPGRFRFKSFPADLSIEPAEIELREGGNDPVVLRWRRAN